MQSLSSTSYILISIILESSLSGHYYIVDLVSVFIKLTTVALNSLSNLF